MVSWSKNNNKGFALCVALVLVPCALFMVAPGSTEEGVNIDALSLDVENFVVASPEKMKFKCDDDETCALLQEAARMLPKQRCPASGSIKFIYPHVPKAGGRSVMATFDTIAHTSSKARYRHISFEPRSRTHHFGIANGHRTFDKLRHKVGCNSDCFQTSKNSCRRWIYSIREPVGRMVSAFYTSTGRLPGHGGHFNCQRNSTAFNRVLDPNYDLEDWVRLPLEERNKCSNLFNLHVNYLASDVKGGPEAQLKEAKKRMASDVGWVLIMEELQESLQLFTYTFGSDFVHYVPFFNLNKYNKNLSALALEVLQEHNKYDIELYEFAVKRHRLMMDAMHADKADPFYKPYSFECDTELKCWSREGRGPSWDVSESSWEKHFANPGDGKDFQVCSPVQGCWRADVSPLKT